MNNIQIFECQQFGQIRTMTDDNGEPLFCLKDVCAALLLDGKQVVRRLDKGVVSKHPLSTSGGSQLASFVNEDGLYDAILDSRKPEAKRFRKWVTSVVLPQIRKTGGYIPIDKEDDEKTILCKAIGIMKRTIERFLHKFSESQNEQRKQNRKAEIKQKSKNELDYVKKKFRREDLAEALKKVGKTTEVRVVISRLAGKGLIERVKGSDYFYKLV